MSARAFNAAPTRKLTRITRALSAAKETVAVRSESGQETQPKRSKRLQDTCHCQSRDFPHRLTKACEHWPKLIDGYGDRVDPAFERYFKARFFPQTR